MRAMPFEGVCNLAQQLQAALQEAAVEAAAAAAQEALAATGAGAAEVAPGAQAQAQAQAPGQKQGSLRDVPSLEVYLNGQLKEVERRVSQG